MLISREELRFDFKGAAFDLEQAADRRLLGWIFNQFLYGEVTGIQCGHWLFHAPHLNAAAFLAKQAAEELSHVRKILRILTLLGEKPAPAHGAVRFLSTGMMGGFWGEHVALEMALGEGLVLGVFYAMADTIPHAEIRKILESAALEEQRHVEFGERETVAWLDAHPDSRPLLLSSALLQIMVLQCLKSYVLKKLMGQVGANHPVLGRFGAFYDHCLGCFQKRMERLGLSLKPVSEMGTLERAGRLALLPVLKLGACFKLKSPLLTSSYLKDPLLLAEQQRGDDRSS